jgi:hypothetical protein
MSISVRVIVKVDTEMKVAEGRKKDKEDVACTLYTVFISLRYLGSVSEVCYRHSLIRQNISAVSVVEFIYM